MFAIFRTGEDEVVRSFDLAVTMAVEVNILSLQFYVTVSMCCVSGWLYVVSQDVARDLVLKSTVVPFFWIDDTYVTGILAEQLSITVRALNK